MWPFKGFKSGGVMKPGISDKDTVSAEQTLAGAMQEWRQVGETFNYLGRECVVTGYGKYIFGAMGLHFINELQADYCDNAGIIRKLVFSVREWRALADKQPNAGVKPGREADSA